MSKLKELICELCPDDVPLWLATIGDKDLIKDQLTLCSKIVLGKEWIMEEIKNLNDLRRGIHKRWIWENKEYYYRSED